jgi:hypothetical protein
MNSSSRSKGLLLSSPIVLDKEKDSVKEKETDAKAADRLRIFGATFGGTLGKSRKPHPRFV